MNTRTHYAARGAAIGVLFANGIGDHITTLPALRALSNAFPPRVVLFAIPELRRMLLADLVVARDIPIHLSTLNGRNRFDPDVAKSFHEEFDLFVSLNPWYSPDVDRILEYLHPALSIGMHDAFDICIRSTQLEHTSDRAFRVVGAIDPNLCINDFTQPPGLSDRSIQAAQKILEGLPRHRRVLAVHNETLRHKVWSHRRLGQVLSQFLSSHEDVVAISLDRKVNAAVLGGCHARLFTPGNLPLDVALAVVSQSDLFLGVDSCMLHMADLCRIPGVGLFGPGESTSLGSEEMGFRFGPHRHVQGHGSMDGIDTASVLRAINELAPP